MYRTLGFTKALLIMECENLEIEEALKTSRGKLQSHIK
jgi:hypothetical protein